MQVATPLLRLSRATAEVRWTSVLRVMLGALFVSVFFENLNKKLYEPAGYATLIRGYKRETSAPGAWKDFMGFIADHASFFAPVQAGFELVLGVCLVLGFAAGAVALVAAGHLTALWVSEWSPRRWVWELLSLVVVAVVVGLASLPTLIGDRRRIAARLLGPPTYRGLGMAGRLLVAVASGAALWVAIRGAKTGGEAHYADIAWQSGVSFGGLMVVLALLDTRRRGGARSAAS
jgi:uncharacterized membrane protein YphA (DoxX/SURF4 family)